MTKPGIKRKNTSKKVGHCRAKKRRKCSKLPDLDNNFMANISNQSLDDQLSDTLLEESFYSLQKTVAASESDDDLDLIMIGTPVQDKNSKFDTGDLVWVKNDVKSCFWPAYIKCAFKKKISILFLCYHKFTKGEKSFSFNVNTKKIKPFDTDDYQDLVKNARKWCKTFELLIDQENMAKAFDEALELAETYVIQSKTFKTEADKLEYFNTKGLSYYHKHCIEEFNSSPLRLSVNGNLPDSSTNEVTIKPPSPIAIDTNSLLKNTNIDNPSTEKLFPKIEHTISNENVTKNKSHTQKKCSRFLTNYNKRNQKLVDFIISGNCEKRLLKIFDLSISSKRMELFNEKWSNKNKINKKLTFNSSYFRDDKQLKDVCLYLQGFIKDKIKTVNGLVKRDDLLFHVFLVEATIYAISKVRRRKIDIAEKVFFTGFCDDSLVEDSELVIPLTEEVRNNIHRRYFRF